jgi:uncharacterized protein
VIEHSGLYIGTVFHRRLRPRAHDLRYRAFWLFLDIDEIDAIAQRLRLFSFNRANVLSLRNADYASGEDRPLRPQVEKQLAEAGIRDAAHRICLLTMPRMLGYGFNPLSIYYCYGAFGRPAAIIYEVTNTYGERHSYVIPCERGETSEIHQSCDKRFYVSPFLDMDMRYAFSLSAPAEKLSVAIKGSDSSGPIISTGLAGKRAPLTDASLARAMLRHPLLTHKVIAGIHWEALRLWLKGLKIRPHPRPPQRPFTAVQAPAHALRKEKHV